MVLGTTHKRHMISAPPAVSSTANAGVCRLPGSNGMERNATFIMRLKCAHVYAAIFPSLSHPLTAVPYRTIFPPSLESMWCIDRGSKSDRL
ncbi:hypothetical protein XELAEV_18033634mg [Xenopus laevis]|uniref:Uncharacterized protein n=1 Tax=Xenopus laevis TaxID=8355 RepID=A0A974CJZ3_XENLA|nr:hypothetical protein XELAEV_18033634mg [Xenopus laevis]